MSVRTTVKSIQDIMRQDTGVDGDAQRISQLCWMFFLKIIDDQDKELELVSGDYRSPIPRKYQWRSWAADAEGMTGEELLNFVNAELFPTLKSLTVSNKPGDRRRVVKDVFEDAYNYMKSGQLMRQVINKINAIDFNNLAERQHFGDIYEQILNDLQSAGNAGEYYTPRAITAFMVNRIDPNPGEVLFDPACGTGGFLTSAIRHMRERYVKTPRQEQTMQAALRAFEKKQLPHMLCVTNMLLHNIEDPSFVRHDNTLAKPYISWEQKDRVDVVLTNPPFGGREEDGIESNFPAHFRTRETADLFLALIIRLLRPGGRAAVVLPDGSLFGEGVKTRLKEHLLEECNLHTIVRLPNSVFRPYASIGTNLLFFEKGSPTTEIWYYEHYVPEGQKAYSMTRPIRIEHLQQCVEWWGGPKREGRRETPQAWKIAVDDIRARGYNLDIKNPHTLADNYGDPAAVASELETAQGRAANLRDKMRTILAGALSEMNGDALLAHFEQIADGPDAVRRLRTLVLDLAVRGKFGGVDMKAGPAHGRDVVKRTAGTVGSRSKSSVTAKTFEGNGAWPVPSSWRFVPLGTLADPNGIFTDGDWVESKDQDPSGGVRLIQLADVGYGEYRDRSSRFMNAETAARLNCTFLKEGDILIARMPDPLGRACIFPGDKRPSVTVVDVAVLRLGTDEFDSRFVVHAINSAPFAKNVEAKAAGTTRSRISRGNLSKLPFPVPKLEEQQHIVEIVDEFMTLCTEFERQIAVSARLKDRLFAALVSEVLVEA